MKCNKCPLFHDPDPYDEDELCHCDLFGADMDSQFVYTDNDGNDGCYIDRHYIKKVAEKIKRNAHHSEVF